MFKPKDTRERIIHRLKISRGHLNKIIKMVEEECYCIDILNQSQAVQAALKEVDNLLLRDYLKLCASDIAKKEKADKAVSEVLQVFKRMN